MTAVPGPPPRYVDPVGGWTTGGEGICQQVWAHEPQADSLIGVGSSETRYSMCGNVASVPVLVGEDPHVVCSRCYPHTLRLPGGRPFPGYEDWVPGPEAV